MTILGFVTGVYPNIFDPEASFGVWQFLFRDTPFNEVLSAFETYCMEKHQYPPKPGDLNEIIQNSKIGKYPPADLIWSQILSCCRKSMNQTQVVELLEGNEPALSALEQVEYEVIRYADIEKVLPYKKRDFEKAYTSAISDKKNIELKRIGTEDAKKFLGDLTQKLIK